MISYAVTLDVFRELILFVSGLLAARRRQIGTRKGTCRLGCYRQALPRAGRVPGQGRYPATGRWVRAAAVHRVPVPGGSS